MRALAASLSAIAFAARLVGLAPAIPTLVVGGAMILLALAAVHLAMPWFGALGLVLGGSTYAIALIVADAPIDPLAPLVALFGFALLEATDVARVRPHVEPGVLASMVGWAVATAVVSVVLGAVALLLSASAQPTGAAAFAGATALTLAALWLLVTVAGPPGREG